MGSGGVQIVSFVAKELRTELYDDPRFQQEALHLGIWLEDLDSLGMKNNKSDIWIWNLK
jgi:hypothetical protein